MTHQMDTQTQVDRLIELAIIQRAELKQLVEQLPQLREHLNAEVERVFEETEPQLRSELEEWTTKQTADKTAALGAALEAKIAQLAKSLEISTQGRYNAIIAEREENARLAAQAEQKIAAHAASLPGAVKEIVESELSRFPRAGEIDQLRKEFAEPRGLNPRGKWQADEVYNKLDLVTINGDSFVSNLDDNRERPSRAAANWTLSAARGNSGGGGGITSLNDLLGNPSAGDIVGSSGTNYVRKTLTAGTGITITDDPNTITIDASGAQEVLTATIKNAESVAITKGQVVYLFGATGNMASVKLAYNTSDATSAKTFGVVSSTSIHAGGTGTVTCVGVLDGLNLGAYNEGDTVYLGATPGSITTTKPYAPNHLVYVGIIERANSGNGELYVKIQNGYELDEIHDVQINSPRLSGQTLIYDATTSLWKNARLTAGVGVSISNGDSAITISADGGVNYQGTWNANSNSPTLTSSVGTKGFYYVVSTAGTTNLNGVTDWQVGDWAIFNSTAWEKVDTTDQVSSVFGRTGAVVGVSTDYSAVGLTNTAIGASNPSTGAFTSLSSSSTTTLNGTTIPASKTLVVTTDKLSALASTSSAELAGVISDETGSGALVFANTPTLVTPNIGAATGSSVNLSGNATVGGTLTVNGAGPHAFSGTININSSSGDIQQNFQRAGTGKGILSVPGTAGNIVADSAVDDFVVRTTSSKAFRVTTDGGNTSALSVTTATTTIAATTASTSTSTGALVVSGGVGVAGAVYVGGKLNLATHTTSAGGIGFGTDISLYRSATNTLAFNTTGNAAVLNVVENGTLTAAIGTVTGDLYLQTQQAGKSVYIKSANAATALTINSSQQVQVNSSTASTSTSTGALVVSGGVGVAGAVNIGGNATFAGVANHPDGSTAAPSIAFTADPDTGFARAATNILEAVAGGVRVATFRSTFLDIPLSTASTSTSSGALVVSGGVGVAKAVYVGNEILTNDTNGAGFRHSAAAGLYRGLKLQTSGSDRWLFASNDASEAGSNAGSDLVLFSYADAGTFLREDLKITRSTGAAKFGGSIQTSAPTGGAGAWELGVANSVTPTSPNRTLTVEIGGTVYYIHAKTTND